MALYAPAVQKLIPPGANDPRIIAVGVILHVDAGNSSSLYTYFSERSGGIESHFHIRKDGTLDQYRDTAYEADANYKGNSWVGSDGKRYGFISVETQGYEMGGWTTAQLNRIKALLTWASNAHGFPLRVCPAWNSPGVGYHVMFGAPGPWTPVAKSCPGPDRIKQFNNIIVPWMSSGGEEDDMNEAEFIALMIEAQKRSTTRGKQLNDALRYIISHNGLATKGPILSPGVRNWAVNKGWDPDEIAPRYELDQTMAHSIDARNDVLVLNQKVDALAALVSQLVAQENADLSADDVRAIIEDAVIKVDVTVIGEDQT